MLGLLSFAPRIPGRFSFDRVRTAGAFDDTDPRRVQIVARILDANPTATHAFLSQFSLSALCEYLQHLESASEPRGRDSSRARSTSAPAITSRRAGA